MKNVNITNFRENLYRMIKQAIKYNELVNISTKDGNAIIMSEDDYNSLMETLYLCSVPGMRKRIMEGLKTPVSECIPENEVEW
jgi:antitoxin YefM